MAHFPFQRLQSDLSALITRTPAGQKLPSEPDLAKKLGVSRATLREAMRSFEAQGMIRRRQGSGTYVIGKTQVLNSGLEVLESVDTIAKRLGLVVVASDIDVQVEAVDSIMAKKLGISAGQKVTSVSRVIHTENRPVAYLVDTLPLTYLSPDDLPADFHSSVVDFLLDRGDPIAYARSNISAVGATAPVAKALEIQRGDVLLHFDSISFDQDGKPYGSSISYFIPGYFEFHIVRKLST